MLAERPLAAAPGASRGATGGRSRIYWVFITLRTTKRWQWRHWSHLYFNKALTCNLITRNILWQTFSGGFFRPPHGIWEGLLWVIFFSCKKALGGIIENRTAIGDTSSPDLWRTAVVMWPPSRRSRDPGGTTKWECSSRKLALKSVTDSER